MRKLAAALVAAAALLPAAALAHGGGTDQYYEVLVPGEVTGLFAVLIAALTAGVRAWGSHADIPPLARSGMSLIHLAGTQFVLGFAAWVATGAAGTATPLYMTLIATAHQTVGALVLAASVRLMLWSWRLLAPKTNGAPAGSAVTA